MVVLVYPPGQTGPQGLQGPAGPQGPSGSSTYVFSQDTPSEVWTITHNLGNFPSVTVVDSAGTTVIGEVDYVNSNQIVLTFSAGFAGTAYLN